MYAFRMLVAGALAAGIGGLGTPAGAQTQLAPEDWPHKEAPMLHEMVEAGTLPPLAERLPAEPRVIKVQSEIGRYGGTMVNGVAFLRSEYIPSTMTMEPFTEVAWPLPAEGPIQANVASAWEFNDDGTAMTLHLREGIKWSDGQPFTADDIVFYWEDILVDEQVARTPPGVLRVGGELPKLEKIGDFTIKLTFKESYLFAETALATMWEVAWPKHVVSKMHPKYNADATYDELNENLIYFNGRGRVTLGAWVLEDYFPGEKFVMVRNPYYWKVDEEGNQLPYIDRLEIREVEDRQSVALGNISGEFDSDGMWVGVQHLQLFLEEQPRRRYDLGWSSVHGMAMYFNMDSTDEVVRNAFRDVNFRRAFSIGINRDEINTVSFNDLLTPRGWAWSPLSPYYDEAQSNLWVKYDPDKARQLLDEGGYTDTNGDGLREAPDGQPLAVVVDVSQHDLYVPINEMIKQQLGDIGLNIVLNVQHQDLIEERRIGRDWQIHVWDQYGAEEPLTSLASWVSFGGGVTGAGATGQVGRTIAGNPFWHQDSAEAPFSPEFVEYSDLLLSAPSLPYEERVAAIKKAGQIMADNVYGVYIGDYERPFIKGHRIANLPDRYARISEFGSNMPAFRYNQAFLRWDKD